MSTAATPGEQAYDALADFFSQLYAFFETGITRFITNFHASFANVSTGRWTKVILSVVGYLIVRPYIEAWFKKMHEKDRKKHMEKKRAQEAAAGAAAAGGSSKEKKKARMSANALRGGGGGRVLGEVENTDDEIEDAEENLNENGGNAASAATTTTITQEDFATASGVPEWGKNARKRQKKFQKSLEKEAEKQTQKLSEEQIMELLDWSEDEAEGRKME
ncbi:uncharacterized protein BP01DRAFT_352968 [Aspergillus saccharolyticus JOP 1030-1]|uniref:DUF1531-domain-containing protein n=1 Tax=Aspergillus saccharolyticus JOP 1030-1 TaxID=1450539 RepID=A0A318ZS40_9EURO|nr:hypothetical protein BP01DRAFT_352968 [Aspergillus saccharolyticus JOP 1030-1]PYH49505.1 hypothetical protein BP01DRAFT_352968 [Aspergillus saccharolyticus JOP 1030-1]